MPSTFLLDRNRRVRNASCIASKLAEGRALLREWAAWCDGKIGEPADNVVPLRAQAFTETRLSDLVISTAVAT
jgi:hypothetical protein